MKKRTRLAGLLLISILLVTGCLGGKENRNTFREAGIKELEAGEYSAAIGSFDQALDHSGGLVGRFELDVLKYRGEAEFLAEDYEAAIHTYDILMETDKERPEYLNMRSIAYARAGSWELALEDYTKASALAGDTEKTIPGSLMALQTVGSVLEDKGELKKAMALYQQAVADGVQNSMIYNRMGLCKLKEQAYEEALGYFDLGIQVGDLDALPQLQFNKAVTYEYMGDYQSALSAMLIYADTYGLDEAAEKEIAFLKTR